jgi:hypothetical protein
MLHALALAPLPNDQALRSVNFVLIHQRFNQLSHHQVEIDELFLPPLVVMLTAALLRD